VRTLGNLILVVGMIAVYGGSGSSAEPGHIIAEEGAVRLVLLRQKSVQDELKLTKDQVDKIHTFADGQWKNAEERHKQDSDKAKPEFDQLHKANLKFIADTL
jgi:hypothetical protein